MSDKILAGCVKVTTALFLVSVILYFYVWVADPNPRVNKSSIDWFYVPLGGDLHVTITKTWGGNIVFFDGNAPYMGGIVGLAGSENIKETGMDTCGIYFRSVKHTLKDDSEQWTLMISLWYPIILLGILLTVFVRKSARRKSATVRQPTE